MIGEGAPTPAEVVARWDAAALADDAEARGQLLRLAVVELPVAEALLAAVPDRLVDARPALRAAALLAAHGLCARRLTPQVAACLTTHAALYVGVPDPLGGYTPWTGAVGRAAPPEPVLAEAQPPALAEAPPPALPEGPPPALPEAPPALDARALRFLVEVPMPGSAAARAGLEAALGIPALRLRAARHLLDEDPAAVVPHLAAMLTADATLAGPLGTRFALVHAEWAVAAAQAVAPLALPVRQAFALDLEKHLRRVSAIKTWVRCRQALFGR